MTPVDELESIIQEASRYPYGDINQKPYKFTSFSETYVLKLSNCYTIIIPDGSYSKYEIEKMYEEIEAAITVRKIVVKNQILEMNRKIIFNRNYKTIPIYYKDCVFTFPYVFLNEELENCIVEGGL